jgi:hypothetical protein
MLPENAVFFSNPKKEIMLFSVLYRLYAIMVSQTGVKLSANMSLTSMHHPGAK